MPEGPRARRTLEKASWQAGKLAESKIDLMAPIVSLKCCIAVSQKQVEKCHH